MKTSYKQVLEFHEVYSCDIGDKQDHKIISKQLRFNLIEEEFMELIKAFILSDYVEVADALGDLVYVAEGAKITFGLPETVVDQTIVDFFESMPVEENVTFLAYALSFLNDALQAEDMAAVENLLNIIIIKCHAIARQFDIPLDEVIEVIHESNLSKLGEDGKPIYREEDNKVLKGPNYFPPTVKIQELLKAKQNV